MQLTFQLTLGPVFGTGKGVITKEVFSLEESLESLKSINSLESFKNDRIRLDFFHSLGISEISRDSNFSRLSSK